MITVLDPFYPDRQLCGGAYKTFELKIDYDLRHFFSHCVSTAYKINIWHI